MISTRMNPAQAAAQIGHLHANGLGVPANNETAVKCAADTSPGLPADPPRSGAPPCAALVPCHGAVARLREVASIDIFPARSDRRYFRTAAAKKSPSGLFGLGLMHLLGARPTFPAFPPPFPAPACRR